MSVQTTSAKTDSCARDGCDERFQVQRAVEGSFCSQECADRSTAGNLLDHIQSDHKYCASCLGVKKDIEPPKPDRAFTESGTGWVVADDSVSVKWFGQETAMDAAVGFEHLTSRAEQGPYGVECACGAVSHDAVDDDFRRHEPFIWHVVTTIDHLREERDKTDRHVDIVTLADALWDGNDLELALGKALD
jgi:hypothetical protein